MMLWQILLAIWLARASSLEPSQFRWFSALERVLVNRGVLIQGFWGSFGLLVLPLLALDLLCRLLDATPLLNLLLQWLVLFVCLTGPTRTHSGITDQQDYLGEIVERWLAPVFWFILAGAVGVLAYRLLALQAHQLPLARKARDWAEWLPVRLLALALPLMGHFSAIQSWRSGLLAEAADNRYWLNQVAEQALLEPVDTERALVKRSLLLLLAVLAALSLSGALN